jgi:hypothetical protein|tara:strand:+ start:2633 stop:2773 length:141 start_codon:yes stop_codon:yes gene_type:complete
MNDKSKEKVDTVDWTQSTTGIEINWTETKTSDYDGIKIKKNEERHI